MAEDLNLLQRKAREWAQKVVELHNTPVPSVLEGQKNSLISFAKKIKETVESIAGPISALEPMNQLGVIPIIIGAVGVTGAIAAITKWTLDYNKFKAKLAEIKSLQAQGMSYEKATALVNSAEQQTFMGGVNKVLLTGGLIFGLYILARKQRWI